MPAAVRITRSTFGTFVEKSPWLCWLVTPVASIVSPGIPSIRHCWPPLPMTAPYGFGDQKPIPTHNNSWTPCPPLHPTRGIYHKTKASYFFYSPVPPPSIIKKQLPSIHPFEYWESAFLRKSIGSNLENFKIYYFFYLENITQKKFKKIIRR